MHHLSLIQALLLLNDEKGLKQKDEYTNTDIQPFEINGENVDSAYKLAQEILTGPFENLSEDSSFLLLLILQMVNQTCASKKMNRANLLFSVEDLKKLSGWDLVQIKHHLQMLKQKRYIRQKRNRYQLIYIGEGNRCEYFSFYQVLRKTCE